MAQEYYGVFYEPLTGHCAYWTLNAGDPDGARVAAVDETGTTWWNSEFSMIPNATGNPLENADEATATMVLSWVRGVIKAYKNLTAEAHVEPSGFNPQTQFIKVSNRGTSEKYNAGRLAESIMRKGKSGAATSFVSELRVAGLVPIA